MKNYFKKFSIMFVMALIIVSGIGVIQNGDIANAATVGQVLTTPESDWKRYDDRDLRIQYSGIGWAKEALSGEYNNTLTFIGVGTSQSNISNCKASFKFYGTKLRLIASLYTDYATLAVKIDGNLVATPNMYGGLTRQVLACDTQNLELKVHTVEIYSLTNGRWDFDAIDIDEIGYLIDSDKSISLNNTILNLTLNNSQELTATTTPSALEVVWTSSDSTIATVDSTGKVTGIKEGQATITAQIKGSETKATCVVNVTATTGGTTEPTEPTTGTGLFIELVDGNIKQYDVSSDEITKFINWYNNRDNDDSQPPYYKFTKGTYKDYVVHDKIDWFEIR